MKQLYEIIKQAEDTHKDGEGYFDLVDAGIKNSEPLLQWLIDLENDKTIILCSGEIGILLKARYHYLAIACLPTLGRKTLSSHHNMIITEWCSFLLQSLKKGDFGYAYVDDSIYSGKTRDCAVTLFEEQYKKFTSSHVTLRYKGTRVIYDGAVIQDPNITSLYRYHP